MPRIASEGRGGGWDIKDNEQVLWNKNRGAASALAGGVS